MYKYFIEAQILKLFLKVNSIDLSGTRMKITAILFVFKTNKFKKIQNFVFFQNVRS